MDHKNLMTFYYEDHFLTYHEELNVSLSTNIDCLFCLKLFDEQIICERLAIWLKNFIIKKNSFKDKWHCSKFYCMSKAIIAFTDVDNEFAKVIFELLINEQRFDGGWGDFDRSTPNETSMNIISILYICERKIAEVNFDVITKASKYLEANNENHPMWIAKILYSNLNLDKTIRLAAKYGIEKYFEKL